MATNIKPITPSQQNRELRELLTTAIFLLQGMSRGYMTPFSLNSPIEEFVNRAQGLALNLDYDENEIDNQRYVS